MVHQQQSELPFFLQNSEGKLSLPTLVGVIVGAMIAAIFLTIAIYIVVVRRFHKYFEAKERVSGQHMSFFQAVESERLNSPSRELEQQRNNKSSSSSSMSSSFSSQFSSSSYSSPSTNNKQEELFDEDFENVKEIKTPKQTTMITQQQKQKQQVREKDLYLSSAREITV